MEAELSQAFDYRARYYNPVTGGFISEDPIRLASGLIR
jgi:RHS repeat-associated protein